MGSLVMPAVCKKLTSMYSCMALTQEIASKSPLRHNCCGYGVGCIYTGRDFVSTLFWIESCTVQEDVDGIFHELKP